MPKLPYNKCCGCTACYSMCPKSAIDMQPDEEGFLYPVISSDLCIECGACESVCPVINHPQLPDDYSAAVVAQSCDPHVLGESTSGGFIDAVYSYVLEELNGYAVGVAYNDEHLPVHMITDSYEVAEQFRNSKYAQSDMSDIFVNIRTLLKNNKTVVFVGTPCQVAGLKTYLSKEYENLITVDLVCRSIPSPKLWRMYLDWQEQRYKSKIHRVSCRKKTYGYHSGTLEIVFQNGKKYSGSNRVDYFMKSFHSDICSRPSCYDCQFKTPHRCSDLTVFDSWQPDVVTHSKIADNDCGYSNVIAHTERGKDIIFRLKNIVLTEASPQKMFEFTGGMESRSIEKPCSRKDFYKDLQEHGLYKTVSKHIKVTYLDKAIEAVKPVFYSIKKRLR